VTAEERNEEIASYGIAHQRLVSALDRFPRKAWRFWPARDRPTIHEVLIHIADSEANSYIQSRRLIAEPGSAVPAYDENGWARELRYHDQSTDDVLEPCKWLRHKSYALMQD
jgi:hypothetical protein